MNSELSLNPDLVRLLQIVITVALLMVSVVFHELAHGLAAYKLGDPTAKCAGRLTLNPLKHIDPFGSIFLPLLMSMGGGPVFGYAKPVPYNPRYFQDLRKGELIVAFAGPLANVIQALLGALLCWGLYFFLKTPQAYVLPSLIIELLVMIVTYYTWINLVLLFFNLLPLPPLDGSAIIAPFLSDKALAVYYQIQQYSLFILLGVLYILPMVLHVNPLGMYMDFTAGNIFNLLVP